MTDDFYTHRMQDRDHCQPDDVTLRPRPYAKPVPRPERRRLLRMPSDAAVERAGWWFVLLVGVFSGLALAFVVMHR